MATQPVSQALHYSNAPALSNAEPLEFEVFQPEGLVVGNLSFLIHILQGGSIPLLNAGVPRMARSIIVDQHARYDIAAIHSSLTACQENVPRF